MEKSWKTIERVLVGDREAARQLVDDLTPVIHARVARVLLHRRPAAPGRDVRQEVEDLIQEVFLLLFDNDCRILRSWDRNRGLSLANFVGLVAERQTISRFRSARSNPWTEDPTEMATLANTVSDEPAGLENRAIARDTLRALVDRLRMELSPLGLKVFQLLYVEERGVASVCSELNMNPDGVYAWRSRLRKRIRAMAQELDQESVSDPAPVQRIPQGGRV